MNIVKHGKSLQFFNEIEILTELPVANYDLVWDPFGNCSLKELDSFKFPEKMYDVEAEFRNQILSTFGALNKNIGVLLEGYKGQGKSLNAKLLAQESGLPIILITKPIPSSINFISFLNDIKTPFVLLIDEFEKIFPNNETPHNNNGDGQKMHGQTSFLSFMDGAISSHHKKLFLLTTNSAIGDKFINRPSRIRYYKKYEFIPEQLFNTILEDKLLNKEHEEDLRNNLPLLDCTIDLLSVIIEEMNLHDMPYSKFKDVFNHKPKKIFYSRHIFTNGKFEYKDTIEELREVTRDTTYLSSSHSIQVLKIEGEYIFYKTKEYVVTPKAVGFDVGTDEDDDDEAKPTGKYQDVFYRLERTDPKPYVF